MSLDQRIELIEKECNVRDWDSYDGDPVTKEALDTVKRLWIVPTSDGGISVNIKDKRSDLSIEINKDGNVEEVYCFPIEGFMLNLNAKYKDGRWEDKLSEEIKNGNTQ